MRFSESKRLYHFLTEEVTEKRKRERKSIFSSTVEILVYFVFSRVNSVLSEQLYNGRGKIGCGEEYSGVFLVLCVRAHR